MKAKKVYEALTDVFQPKARHDLDVDLMDKLGMNYDEFHEFAKQIIMDRADVFPGGREDTVTDKVRSGEWRVEPTLRGISLYDKDGKQMMGFQMTNLNKVRKIGDEIGIPGETFGYEGIYNNFVVDPVSHNIYADFIDEDGEKTEEIRLMYRGKQNNMASIKPDFDGVANTTGGSWGSFATLAFMRAKDNAKQKLPLTHLFG